MQAKIFKDKGIIRNIDNKKKDCKTTRLSNSAQKLKHTRVCIRNY